MKKWISAFIAFFVVLSLSGIANSEPLKLKMQTNLPPEQMKRSYTPFVEMVKNVTGGRITITPYPIGTLVPPQAMFEAVRTGAVDMLGTAEGYWFKNVPVSEIAQGLPFLFRDSVESAYFMYHYGFVDLLREGYAKHNIYVMPFETYGVGLMTKKPILKAEDLKGVKLRAYGTMAKWLTKMGASPVYIPGGELYTALSTGVVDGAHWGDAYTMYELKLHEVLKNYMLPEPIQGSWNTVMVNMDLWKKLSPEDQAMLQTAVWGGGDFWGHFDTRMKYKIALNDMVANWDVKVNQVPDAEIEKMRKTAMEVWDEIAKGDPLAAKGVKMIYDFVKMRDKK